MGNSDNTELRPAPEELEVDADTRPVPSELEGKRGRGTLRGRGVPDLLVEYSERVDRLGTPDGVSDSWDLKVVRTEVTEDRSTRGGSGVTE